MISKKSLMLREEPEFKKHSQNLAKPRGHFVRRIFMVESGNYFNNDKSTMSVVNWHCILTTIRDFLRYWKVRIWKHYKQRIFLFFYYRQGNNIGFTYTSFIVLLYGPNSKESIQENILGLITIKRIVMKETITNGRSTSEMRICFGHK
ncbi:hypothetical protein ACH3XW_20850 [Acanthocheilonema viteae]